MDKSTISAAAGSRFYSPATSTNQIEFRAFGNER